MKFNIIGKWHHSRSGSTIEFYKNYDFADSYFVDYFVNGEQSCNKAEINLAGYESGGVRLWNIDNGVVIGADTLELMPDQRLKLSVSKRPGFDKIYERVK